MGLGHEPSHYLDNITCVDINHISWKLYSIAKKVDLPKSYDDLGKSTKKVGNDISKPAKSNTRWIC